MSGGAKAGKGKARFLLPNAVIPLAVGLLLYVLFCPETYVTRFVSRVFPAFTAGTAVVPLPETPVFSAIRCWGFDFLWAYALVFALGLITGTGKGQLGLAVTVAAGFEVLSELLQRFGAIPGTPDVLDVLTEISATLIGALIIDIHTRKERKNEK
ncbi:MAG: hypothetical protein MJ070_06635 [Lachnospiraceae bacterium]|nr:hypothetical protein [Lachnospiraceae bacterium]